jgi:hypothetical protein
MRAIFMIFIDRLYTFSLGLDLYGLATNGTSI